MITVLVPFISRIGGGGAITVVSTEENRAIYWELVSYDPETGFEGPAYGSLKWEMTKTDATKRSMNFYFAPTDPIYAGKIDRVKIRHGTV
jgi:hypothetical protein